jgi:hypothetical protein
LCMQEVMHANTGYNIEQPLKHSMDEMKWTI